MEPINLFDYEALARERLDPTAWNYYQSGAEDEVTLRENRAAFERIKLRPRMLGGVGDGDTRITLLGEAFAAPLIVAPMAYQKLAHPDGEAEMARGAGAADAIMVVSTLANTSLERVAEAATRPLWFQLYVYKDRDVTESLVRRAEAAGYQALVLTVDAPHLGRRERDIRSGFGLPPGLTVANFEGALADQPGMDPGKSGLAVYASSLLDSSLTWESVEWMRSITSMPILVKGILTAEDAREAMERGVEGVIVSNHGGRQLDGAVAAIEALPEVVAAVDGRGLTLMDGGVRRGTDVLKALALGANATLIGRPALWALAARGAPGVTHAFGLLRDELRLAMTLSGCKTVADIHPALARLPSGWRPGA